MDEKIINLAKGQPSLSISKEMIPLMQEGTKHRLASETGELMFYGPNMGDGKFLDNLATFLSQEYGELVSRDELMVTAGATQGLWFVASNLLANNIVFVEDPTYYYILDAFHRDLKMKIVSIPENEAGIDITAFTNILSDYHNSLKECSTRRPFKGLIYLIPNYHNPTGRCLHEDQSRDLISIAKKNDLLIICDDVYNMLNYSDDKTSARRLFSLDIRSEPNCLGNVISNGSFSKVLFPSIRLGWLEAPTWILSILNTSGFLSSGGSFNHYTAGIVASILELGLLSEKLSSIREKYKRNLNAVCNILDKQLPSSVHFKKPKGGYFIWLELPEYCSSQQLEDLVLKKFHVKIMKGELFSFSGRFKNCIRICFTFNDFDDLIKGVNLLCQAIRETTEKTSS